MEDMIQGLVPDLERKSEGSVYGEGDSWPRIWI